MPSQQLTPRRILLVTPQPFYEDRGTPIAVAHTVRALSQLGYSVDLLAFPFGKQVAMPRVTTIRCGNPLGLQSVPIGFSWQKCALDASLTRSFERLLRTGSYDMVHAVEEAAYVASRICQRLRQPFIYDMASSIPAELASKPLLRSNTVQRWLRSVESSVIERAAHVVCSTGLGETVRQHAHSTPTTEWRFPAVLEPPQAKEIEAIRERLNIQPEDKVIGYCGNFARYQGMDLLFAAFEKALERNGNLLLVCVGASENERRTWLSRLLPQTQARVRIIRRRPRSEVSSYLALADVLVSLRPVSQNLPLKVFEYMASGTPIVATRGPAHEPVLNSSRAFLCDPTEQSVADGLIEAIDSPRLARDVAARAASYASARLGWGAFVNFVKGVYDEAFIASADVSERARALN